MLITLSITSVLGRGQLLYPVDGGQVVLSDPAGTVSVFRADTGAVLVAPTLDGNGNPVGPVATAVSPGVAVYTATVTVPDGTPLDEIKWHGLPTIRGYVKPTVYPNGSSTAGATTAPQNGLTPDGSVRVDQNTGGADALQVVTVAGQPIVGAVIRAYRAAEYAASASAATLRGETVTGSDGNWLQPMYLAPATSYTLVITTTDGRPADVVPLLLS